MHHFVRSNGGSLRRSQFNRYRETQSTCRYISSTISVKMPAARKKVSEGNAVIVDEVLSAATYTVGRPRRDTSVSNATPSNRETQPGRRSVSASDTTRGHKVTRGQNSKNAGTPEVNAATRDGGHSSRLESTNPHGTTGGTRARGSVEFVSASTREHEDAGNPGEVNYTGDSSQPSADDVPSQQMAPPRRRLKQLRRNRRSKRLRLQVW